ncbi:MAG TPA: hypothetical protein VFX29_03130, partial [Longimicrobiaceae bacterium]|nr:hypothetical protein [Longimicrobiaceae bacterium]
RWCARLRAGSEAAPQPPAPQPPPAPAVREMHGAPAPDGAERCEICGSERIVWRNCKLICQNCRQIVKSCADL